MEFLKAKHLEWKKIQEAMVLAAIACLTISYFGGYYLIITTIGHHSTLLRKMAVVLLFFKVLTTRYTKKEFGFVAVLLSLAFVNYKVSGNTRAIYNFLTICALKDVELKKVFRVSLVSLVFIVVLMGVLALTGVTGTVSITDYFGRMDPETGYAKLETRYCMGYIHPNSWAQAIFAIMTLIVAGFYEKLDWKCVIFLVILNCVVYCLSISRTGLLGGLILLLLLVFAKYGKKIFDFLIVKIGLLTSVIMLWGSVCIGKLDLSMEWIQILDQKVFTRRLAMAQLFYKIFGISPFGENIPSQLEYGHVLDMGYMRMLLENGTLIYILFFLAVIILMVDAFRNQRKEIVILAISICLYGLYENEAIAQVPANLMIYYMAELVFRKERAKDLPQELKHGKIK